ncbi:MAG: IS66 family transposase [Gammaproteobacteria bacterium]|nr:IS66 family transposase [Gammaproteobacteria bacterium]
MKISGGGCYRVMILKAMQTAPESLPGNPEQLKKLLLSESVLLAQKVDEIVHLKQQYQQILGQFRLAQQRQFGKSSEASPDQLGLFNEAEQIDEAVQEGTPDEQETLTYTRNKPKRKPLPKDLPREQIIHDLDAADKVCACCANELHCMGEEKSEQLAFIPAQVKVIEHIRPKYSCRHCEQEGIAVDIKIAPVPPSPIPKSIATPSLLSQIITCKYQYALPLYRQESLFKQYGIELSRKTMASWAIQSSLILMILYQRLREIQFQQSSINAYETPLKVIHEDKSPCYMWVYCTGTDSPQERTPSDKNQPPPNIMLYEYQNSRSGRCARDYLKGYQGYLQVDGYAGYEQTEARLVGCFAYARRKFIEAQKVQVKGKTGKADQ